MFTHPAAAFFANAKPEVLEMLVNNMATDGAYDFCSDFYGSYAPWYLFNGAEKTQAQYGWQSANTSVIGKYCGRHVGATGRIFRQLKIWNGQYYSGWRFNAKDLLVEGSNDAVVNSGTGYLSTVGTWTKIPVTAITGGSIINTDEARLDAEAGSGVTPTSVLTLGGFTAYKALRLRFTSNTWGASYVQLRELEIYVVQ